MRHALFLPPFGPLFSPRVLADLAAEAERAGGWDGLFLWDHVLRPATDPSEVADPWICLAAIACATTTLRIGTMVTPLTRRRPIKLAREIVTLDHLSEGRLTVGLGLGVDTGRELSGFGEVIDPLVRAERLDEGTALVRTMLAGGTVAHAGPHFVADGVRFEPRPVQDPVPFWFAARKGRLAPTRRAARYEGLFPIEADLAALDVQVAEVSRVRGGLEGFDVAVLSTLLDVAGTEESLASHGVTWVLHSLMPGADASVVRALIKRRSKVA